MALSRQRTEAKVFISGINNGNLEEELMAGIKCMALKDHNNMVNIIEFHSMRQDQDVLVSGFSARLSGKGNTCNFTVKCT